MSLEKSASAPAPSAEEYKEIETTIATKRAELSTSPVDRMGELVAEIQELEAKKVDAFDSSYEEAAAENSRMDAEQVAFETAHDEAHVENERLDAEKAAQNKRVAAIDTEITNERARLNGATAEDLGAIVQRIKELESQKTRSPEARPQAEDKNTSQAETESAENLALEEKFSTAVERLDSATESLRREQEKIKEAKFLIAEVEALPAGSREKYDAAFAMRSKVENLLVGEYGQHPSMYKSESVDSTGYYNALLGSAEYTQRHLEESSSVVPSSDIESMTQRLEQHRIEVDKTAQERQKAVDESVVVLWEAKGEYESISDEERGARSIERARVQKEISSGSVSLERARDLILNEDKKLGDGGPSANLAYELLQRFIAEDRKDDAVEIAILAHDQGLYGKINHAGLFNLASQLSDTLNIQNREEYTKLNAVIDLEDKASHRRHVSYRKSSKTA